MILVAGSPTFQFHPAALTDTERKILQNKQQSQTVYHYPSLDALEFELKMRFHIVEAAKAMNASRAEFATFATSRCNHQYWIRTNNGGFQLRSGMSPAVAINDIFVHGELYAFECAVAMIIILYKATWDTVGDRVFDAYFQNLFLRDWQYDRDLRLNITFNKYEVYEGDILYFKNPDHSLEHPEWQGENAVKLDRDLYFGHGIGIKSGQEIIEALNRMRKEGSTVSAYLEDLVVTPDFEYLRGLSIG